MPESRAVHLAGRSFLRVTGEDARTFLQGLISNDVGKCRPERAIWSAFLTPQGKFLFDFFLAEGEGHALWLECEAARIEDFKKRLSMYKLRSKVAIELAPDWIAAAAIGRNALGLLGLDAQPGACKPVAGGLAYVDPRLAEGGARLILPASSGLQPLLALGFAEAPMAAWDTHRIALGLPDGSRDLVPDRTLLLEAGFDELQGVDFKKGCYMGQELTARTKYRGLIKKRLMPVAVEGPTPPAGAILSKNGQEAGEMRSSVGGMGLAFLRLELLDEPAPFEAEGGAKLTPLKPAWATWG